MFQEKTKMEYTFRNLMYYIKGQILSTQEMCTIAASRQLQAFTSI